MSRLRAAWGVLRDYALLTADAARPYRPMEGGARRLEAEYRDGIWDYLAGDEELPRFGVVAAYCGRYAQGGDLLELGCGEGLLAARLAPGAVGRFVGVDMAETPIARARALEVPGATFVTADAATYEPEGTFTVIVFHEMLEYLADPAATVRRYERWLAPGGVFVVSQYRSPDNARTRRIWRSLHDRYTVRARASITVTRQLRWTVEALSLPADSA